MADLVSRLVDVAQDPTHSPEDRAKASAMLGQLKTTKDRLMSVAGDESLDHGVRDQARAHLHQFGAIQPPPVLPRGVRGSDPYQLMSSEAPGAPTTDESLGLDRGPEASNFNDLGQTHPMLSAALSRGGEQAQDRAALNDLTPEDRKKMNAVVGGTLVGAGAGALLGPAVGAATRFLPGVAAPIAEAAGVGAGSGYAQGTSQGLFEGKSLRDANAEGVDSAKVAAVAGPFAHVVGEGVSLAAPLASEAQGLLRQNRWIGGKAAAEEAGMYRDPAMQSLPSGLEGERRASEVARDRILTRDAEMSVAEGDAHGKGVEALPGIDGPISVANVHRRLNRSVQRYDGSGRPVVPAAEKTVDEVKDNLRSVTRQRINPVYGATEVIDGPAGTQSRTPVLALEPGEKVATATASPRDLLTQRRAIAKKAQFGQPPTAENEGPREVYFAADDAVKEAVPGIKPLDERYTGFKRGQARRNDILFKSEGGGRQVDLSDPSSLEAKQYVEAQGAPIGDRMKNLTPDLRVNDEIKAATAISRVGDDTAEGLRMAPYLEELGKQDPEFAKALQFMEAKKALEGTRFHYRNMLPSNLHDATAQLKHFSLGMLEQNSRALGATADTALGGVGQALQKGPQLTVNPIVRAMIIEKARDAQRDQMLADNFKAGGR